MKHTGERPGGKRRLAFVLPHHWSTVMGGAEGQAKYLMDSLVQDGAWELYYLCSTADENFSPDGYRIISIGNFDTFRYHRLYRDTRLLMKALGEIGPEVVYQRVGCAFTGIAAYYSRRNDCRMVWHVAHDSDVRPYRGARLRWLLDTFIEKKYLEFGVRNSTEIITQTRQQADYLYKFYGRCAGAVVPNFHPCPVEQIRKDGPLRIVWIANIKEWKQPEEFVRLARDLQERKADVSCYMIGRGSRSRKWQQAFEREVDSVGNLSYLGPRTMEEVNSFLAESHILVNTSTEEGLANTFIQAWMRKVPVVSMCCDFDNVLTEHNVGFHSGSYEGMLADVLKLIENEKLREIMGEAAQQYALEVHALKNVEILKGILKA